MAITVGTPRESSERIVGDDLILLVVRIKELLLGSVKLQISTI